MSDIDSLDNRNMGLIEWLSQLSWVPKKYFRSRVEGLENIPRGAGLYVANHNMGLLSLDTVIFCAEAYKKLGVDALPYGLAHDVPLKAPLVGRIISGVGGVRACHENAASVFAAGKKALVYPGGDLDAQRPFRHRDKIVFGGRTGYIRLALNAAVPIIPVVAAGAHSAYIILDDMRWLARGLRLDKTFRTEVWPLTLCLPWGLTLGPNPFFIPFPTRILIEALPPIRFERSGPEAARDDAYVAVCARLVESRMQEALTRLARERRKKSVLRGLKKRLALGNPPSGA